MKFSSCSYFIQVSSEEASEDEAPTANKPKPADDLDSEEVSYFSLLVYRLALHDPPDFNYNNNNNNNKSFISSQWSYTYIHISSH